VTATKIDSGAVGSAAIANGGVDTVDLANGAVTYAKLSSGSIRSDATATTDGATITHGFASAPTLVVATGSIAGEIVTITNIGAANFTVAIKDNDGTPGTAQTIYWIAILK